MLLLAVEHLPFQWTNPHWGWFFAGFAAGTIVVLITHRVRNG